MPEVALVGVTDTDPRRAGELAATGGTWVAADTDELLGRGVDALWVCVPPFAHGTIEERAAATGVGLFVEKPLGLTVADARRVHSAVTAAAIPTAVGHHWR